MSHIERVLTSAGGTLLIACIAFGYIWIRAMHYQQAGAGQKPILPCLDLI